MLQRFCVQVSEVNSRAWSLPFRLSRDAAKTMILDVDTPEPLAAFFLP